jgi:heptosyltransferase-2
VIVRGNPIQNPKKIMVRTPNWIGDAVICLPAIEALRAAYPSAEIVTLAKPWVSELYRFHPAVSRQMVFDPSGEHAGSRGFWKLVRELKSEQFDGAILFQNAFHAAWMAWCARIPARVGYAREARGPLLTSAIEIPSPAAYGHQAYYYLQLLFRAGVIERPQVAEENEPLHVSLALDPREQAWARRYLDGLGLHGNRYLIGINPSASFGPAKRWPVENFAALADRLIEVLSADVLIFGSETDRPLADQMADSMNHTPIVLAGETNLRQFMALLAQSRLVITNDSGPMHLAAALDVPLVAIFGSTDDLATGPISPKARVVKYPVACSPCGLRVCPIDFRCMTGVSVDMVYRAALELVKKAEVRR